MAESKTKQVNFRVTDEIYQGIKKRAEERGQTVSNYVGDVVSWDIDFAGDGVATDNRDLLLALLKQIGEQSQLIRELSGRVADLDR